MLKGNIVDVLAISYFCWWMLLSWLLYLTYDPNGDMLIVATLLPFGEILAKINVGMQRPLDVIH